MGRVRITRPFVLLALAALLAPQAVASRTSVWERNPPAALTTTKTDAAGLLPALAPAARLNAGALPDAETTETPLFNLGDVVLVDHDSEREERFDLGPLTLVDLNLLRGPPPSYPETRVGGFELLPLFRVGASPSLSLWSRQACGFSCGEVASDSRYDPWGLCGKLSECLFVPQGFVYTQHLAASVEIADRRNTVLARLGYGALDAAVLPLAWAEEYGARGLLNLPHLVAKTTEESSERLVEGISEGDAAKVSEGAGGFLFAFFAAGSSFTPWSSEFRPIPEPSVAPRPVSGETPATRAGKSTHKVLAEEHRASGEFPYVDEPLRDESGRSIQVARRVDLRTGEPVGTRTATPRPDAVRFDNGGLIL
jgi:hypothetical protein